MALCCNRFWKLLIDRGMTHAQMRLAAGISTTTHAKLSKDDDVAWLTQSQILRSLWRELCGGSRETEHGTSGVGVRKENYKNYIEKSLDKFRFATLRFRQEV